MNKKSAGILAYRVRSGTLEVLLVHPGGPFFAKKDAGVWSVPKGEFEDDEDALSAAKREFEEEIGVAIEDGVFTPLAPVKLKSGKIVYAWGIKSALEIEEVRSNLFSMEWPPKSGRMQEFPEVDKAEWFITEIAKQKINPAQAPLIDELAALTNTNK